MGNESLCEACQVVFAVVNYDPYQVLVYKYTRGGFQESATNGCQFCAMRWVRLSPEERSELLKYEHRVTFTYHGKSRTLSEPMLQFSFSLECGDQDLPVPLLRRVARLEFLLIPLEGRPEHSRFDNLEECFSSLSDVCLDSTGIVIDTTVAESTKLSESFSLIKRWYDDCQQNHPKCQSPSSSENVYPARLIDLGCGQELEPCLRDTSELEAGFRYLTLSHRWGDHRILCLRTANIEQMRKRVLEPAISKTFREAMLVVKALGERYLWIDSLCIIQDSPDRSDWFEESAKMHAIYANAFCNISATGAFDGRDGCFFDRSPLYVQPLRVEITLDGFKDVPHGSYLCLDWDIWSESVDYAPLTLRAWVLQERLLSRRVIHFDRRQILWECREKQSCETFPYGLPPRFQTSHTNLYKAIDPEVEGARVSKRKGRSSNPEQDVYELWNLIVETYTRASLTMEDDKFVALMGLTQHIQKLLNQRYFAGLWGKNIAEQLLWSATSDRRMVKPRKYIAPSWSWASLIGPIKRAYPTHNLTSDTLIQAIRLEVRTINDHPLGQVTSGSLRLRGSLVRGMLWTETHPRDTWTRTCLKYDIYDDGSLKQVDYQPRPDLSDLPGPLYTLPIKRASGLLLQLTRQHIREFRRVGTVSVKDLDPPNACTRYINSVGIDPLSADDVWLDGFILDGKTIDSLTII